ncbi:MAG TPA: ABC transporter ATP-binding protein [Chloroflexota bacterium]
MAQPTEVPTAVTEAAAISVRGLVKRYGQITAVDGIDLDVQPGEIFGFLGPNGAGKSTTIKILCTLVPATSGSARVAGHDVRTERDAVRRNIGLVFQEPTLDGYLTAEQNLRFHCELYGMPRAVARARREEVLAMVSLLDRRWDLVQTYSGGMKRRLEIARGLLHSPRVLFLDEPTIGLDVTMQSRIRRFVAEYNRRTGATILLTSHYMDDVVALCRRVIVIHHGHLLYDGGLADLAERMAPYKLIRVTLRDAVIGMPLERYGEPIEREGNQVTLKVARVEAPERIARLVQDLGGQVLDLTLEDPAIEAVIDRVFSSAEVTLAAEASTAAARS